MTSRDRVRAVLEGGKPDRPPFNFWMDRDAMARLDRELGEDFRISHFGADVVEAFGVADIFPTARGEYYFDGKTSWMLKGKVERPEEALELPLCDPADPAIYADVEAKRRKYPDKAIFTLVTVPLGLLNSLLPPQELMEAMALEGDVIDRILARAWPVMKEVIRRVCDMDIDVLYLAEDFCMSTGLMYSPAMIRRFHLDYLREAVLIARRAGKKVFYHTDGRVIEALPLLTELGVDGVNPLEPRYNPPEEFLRASEGRLMLYGGMDNTRILPQGTPEEIEEHIRRVYDAFAPTGLIFSSHDIPGSAPLENLEAMASAIKS
ncbi:MAG: hypothetical protein IJT95_01670, partial [Abditibacteriota bacterium]|nr:hypothetical protein [Abditibacteriota bacterium]